MRILRPLDAVKFNLVTIPMTAKVGCSIVLTEYNGAFDDQWQALLASSDINKNCPTVADCHFENDDIQIYVKPSVMCDIRTKRIQVVGMPSSN